MLILITGTGKIIKNYEDDKHPDLLHLPFHDPSYSLLKHLFFKKNGPCIVEISHDVTKTHDNISHQHPVVLLEDARCTSPPSSRIKSISFHDPMKRIELLCNGCLRPITSTPIYMCANEDDHCNFVLHEWCSRLPTELKDHHDHTKHTLILHSTVPGKFFGVFTCNICTLPCNGFVYYCEKCEYHIDVNCAFLPKEITHASHPNHLLSRVIQSRYTNYRCKICWENLREFSFSCHICDDFHLHPECALLIPETTMHKCDRHPMKLSYFPIENHKSEYFCEICEEKFDPEFPFYHCHKCMQSMHPACAPSILWYETYTTGNSDARAIFKFVNVKFGGTFNNFKVHQHPLSFIQGIESDGQCNKCGDSLQYNMIFKCLDCKYALHYVCCKIRYKYPGFRGLLS
ncbi:hypothetical protein L1987_47522 [Smallanthus sonchifolius]|uniref:Uncharacterized protein n=1 Tax=Smallanthus sonchifolius TaxID=185202 RepID=A0ACB9G2V9_9ASTR|nr:hypothetical protein L1987_47522 [Smallanthus sonchifolius]